MTTCNDTIKQKLVASAAELSVFDGWSEKTLKSAATNEGISYAKAKSLFPRGGIDLAKSFHQFGDQDFLTNFGKIDISRLSHSEKVAKALKIRFMVIAKNKEAFRRSMALFAMPMYHLEAINLVWSTCDLIWVQIKGESFGISWYTKRATLVSVYLSTLLFFLGDSSADHEDTECFIMRRLGDVSKLGQIKLDFVEFVKNMTVQNR